MVEPTDEEVKERAAIVVLKVKDKETRAKNICANKVPPLVETDKSSVSMKMKVFTCVAYEVKKIDKANNEGKWNEKIDKLMKTYFLFEKY